MSGDIRRKRLLVESALHNFVVTPVVMQEAYAYDVDEPEVIYAAGKPADA